MRKPKTPAQSLTDNFVEAIGKIWPSTIMNWDTKLNGTFVPWGYVNKAIATLRYEKNIEKAIALLLHPVKGGLIGGPDVSSTIGHAPKAQVAPGTFCGFEIKAQYADGSSDRQGDEQIICERNLRRHGAVYVIVEDVDSGVERLRQFAGPGEK